MDTVVFIAGLIAVIAIVASIAALILQISFLQHQNGLAKELNSSLQEKLDATAKELLDLQKQKETTISKTGKYCLDCAAALEVRFEAGQDRLCCTSCKFVLWVNPKPVAVVIVPMGDGILMVERGIEPFIGTWCLPGGYVESGESLEDAGAREVFEEAGVRVRIKKILGAFAGPKKQNVLLLFMLAEPCDQTPVAGPESLSVGVFRKGQLPEKLSFPSHTKAAENYLDGKYND